MTQRPVFTVIGIITFITLLVLVLGFYSLNATMTSRTDAMMKRAIALGDSIAILQSEIDSLKDQAPGLGEYMTTFQLHMAKLWYAVQASNWGLAQYELGELTETVEAAEALHAVKNNVNTASVLQSVRETQLATLQSSIQKKNTSAFARAYDQTIQTCNSCHRSIGYGFINIIKPLAPPVANQSWKLVQ
jgi:hypothetical protein